MPQRFDLFAYLFNAAGRSGRTSFMLGMLSLGLVDVGLIYVLIKLGIFIFVDWLIRVLMFGLNGVLSARRLHDLGLSGWWYAPITLLAWSWIAQFHGPPWAFWTLLVPNAVVAFILFFAPGQDRFNRFGPPPR